MNSPSLAEEFLIENQLVERRSPQRRRLLGCLACQWSKSTANSLPKAYGYAIWTCQGLSGGLLYPSLEGLEEVGVATSEVHAPTKDGVPSRRYYSPAENELGQGFAAALEADIPLICPTRTGS